MDERIKMKRAEAARDAIASARLEGREPTPELLALLDRFVAGEITIEQALEIINDAYDPGSDGAETALICGFRE